MSETDFVSVYEGRWPKVKLILDGVEKVCYVYVRWVDSRMDSHELWADIQSQVAKELGIKRLPRAEAFRLKSVLPRSFAGETEIDVSPALPSARSRVVLHALYKSQAELDLCFTFEELLDAHLEGSDIGFVDGNDVGGGEFQIYCHGPKKAPLLEKVKLFVGNDIRWKIR